MKSLSFYTVMKYPIPRQWEYFTFQEQHTIHQTPSGDFSRDQKNPYMEDFLAYIKQYNALYQSIPFVESIYLCNSITFNALQKDSDIDLFIIAKKGALRRARIWSRFFFFFKGIKRSSQKKEKKFCLSFYVTEDAVNLYPISIAETDIYLTYRLAHLVPLYQETKKNIYTHNQWITGLLSNFPQQQVINLGLPILTGKTNIKERIEQYLGGFIGIVIEQMIKIIRLPIVLRKTRHLGEQSKGIIINDHMLKFYEDKRKKIHLLWSLTRDN